MKNKKKTVTSLAASLVLLLSPFTLAADEGETQGAAANPIREILNALTPEQIEQLRTALRSEDPAVRASVWAEMRAAAQQQATATDADEGDDAFINGLELRGITSVPGEGLSFSIHDSEGNRTFSLQVGQSRNGVTLKAHDRETDRITLVSNGTERQIGLSAARIATLEEPAESAQARRERWQAMQAERGQRERQERMERMQQIRERWEEAARNDPELQRIQRAFQEAGGDARRAMAAARESGASPEEMRELGAEMRQEFQDLSQRAVQAMQNNSAFEGLNISEEDRVLPFGGPGGPGGGEQRRGPRGGGGAQRGGR